MIQIHECEQGSEDWFRARMGIPTASEFSTLLAKGRDGGDSRTRKTYMLKLAGEILTGEPMGRFSNSHTDRGHEMEPEARDLYAFAHGVQPQLVGFITNGPKGCSPDALIGTDGVLEIKTKEPHLLIECILKGNFPAEHVAQCQGALWVTEREWVDLIVYWPGLPPYERRAYRDEPYIKRLSDAVDEFNAELAEMVERVRRYGTERRAAA